MIYVTDDHADAAGYLVRLLKKAGLEAAAFSCGPDLLKAMAARRPSLVVLDMMMPEMSGLECLAAIRSSAAVADVPVIVYTADFTYEAMDAARKAGATDILIKGGGELPRLPEDRRQVRRSPRRASAAGIAPPLWPETPAPASAPKALPDAFIPQRIGNPRYGILSACGGLASEEHCLLRS